MTVWKNQMFAAAKMCEGVIEGNICKGKMRYLFVNNVVMIC